MQTHSVSATTFLYGLAIFGVISAFFGSFVALAETDIKRVIAYSSISHMGYILFGASLIPKPRHRQEVIIQYAA